MADDTYRPTFSIVVVTLNARRHVAEALRSVLGQGFEDYEVVVVDGGSTDGTLDVVREHERAAAGRLRWVSEPDEGLYDAMNKGLRMARGAYVEYLGADDRLAGDALAAVARVLDEHQGVTVVCGGTRVFGDAGSWLETPRKVVRGGLPKSAPVRHQSIFVRREALEAVGGFDTRYRIAADYDLYLRLQEADASEVLTESVLSEFRLGGVSSSNAAATAREYRDIRIAHGRPEAIEQAVMLKSILAATAFMAWKRAVGGLRWRRR